MLNVFWGFYVFSLLSLLLMFPMKSASIVKVEVSRERKCSGCVEVDGGAGS